MALTDFIQSAKITDWVQEQIGVTSLARSLFNSRIVGGATSVVFPVASSGSVKDYTVGMDLVNTNVTSSNVTVALDKKWYEMRNIDNVESAMAAQAIVPQVALDMGNIFARKFDQTAFLAAHVAAIAGGISSATLFGTQAAPITVDDTTKLETLFLNIRKALVKADIALEDSFMVMPAELGTLAAKLSANSYRDGQNAEAFGAGYITTAYGINLFESNNLPLLAAGKRGFIFGHKMATCVAIGYENAITGSSMPTKFGEYIAQIFAGGFGANNPALLGAGCIVEA